MKPLVVLLVCVSASFTSLGASTNTPPAATGAKRTLFDGKTLSGWAITGFAGKGEVHVENGLMILEQGLMTGVHYTNAVLKTNYELTLEARRMQGSDFFCGLTFPMAGTNVSLIVGGWGGGVVGISSIDGNDASSNDTTKFMAFERERWYVVRVRVTPAKLEAWLDKEKVVDVVTEGKTFGLRSGAIEESVPLGICTYETTAQLRNIVVQELAPATR